MDHPHIRHKSLPMVRRNIRDGSLFRGEWTEGMSADAIADVVTTYARPFGWDLAPHDLRRTFAKLARSGQAPLEQIQLALR
jgi:integrase